jgi:transcriptional regulator with XRE-family HTH domain
MLRMGERIRSARKQRGLSQGDLQQRTGLLRCYLSRVENGHTEPSLQTLNRIAAALEMPMVGFFTEPPPECPAPEMNPQAVGFLAQMRQYAGELSEADRAQVLTMARKMAAGAGK